MANTILQHITVRDKEVLQRKLSETYKTRLFKAQQNKIAENLTCRETKCASRYVLS